MPSQAAIAEFGDAFLAVLNGAASGFVIPFTANRVYLAVTDRNKISTNLVVSVCPRALTEEAAARSISQEDYHISVGLQQAVDVNNIAAIDQLMLLVDQIRDLMRFQTISGCGWVGTQVPLIFAPDKMIENREFVCEINFTFRTMRG